MSQKSLLDELFVGSTSWPRLILKALAEGIICYNFYHYSGAHRPDWDCWATERRQPYGTLKGASNDGGSGENMTDQFSSIINMGFYVSLFACIVTILEIINKPKSMQKKSINTLVGVCDSLIGIVAFGWLIWATVVRLSRDGKICAGATTNVTETSYPYAYDQGQFLIVMLVLMYVVPVTLWVATNCGCL